MANSMKPRKEIKKPTKGKAAAAGDEPDYADINRGEDDEDAGAAFDAEKFLEHVDTIGELKRKGAEIRGKIGAAVKNAEEDYGVHRGAASLMIKLKGQSDEQRAAFFKAFDDMRAALGWAEQGELFSGRNTPAERATFAGRDV